MAPWTDSVFACGTAWAADAPGLKQTQKVHWKHDFSLNRGISIMNMEHVGYWQFQNYVFFLFSVSHWEKNPANHRCRCRSPKLPFFCRDSMPKGGHRCVASSVSAQEFEISKHWLLNLVHLFPTIRGKLLFRARLTSWLLSLVPVLVGCMGYTADWKMILLDYMWLCLCHFWFCFNISPRFQVFFCGILWYGSWLFSCVSCILCSLFDPLNSRMPK